MEAKLLAHHGLGLVDKAQWTCLVVAVAANKQSKQLLIPTLIATLGSKSRRYCIPLDLYIYMHLS
jgi:hypothetical protein